MLRTFLFSLSALSSLLAGCVSFSNIQAGSTIQLGPDESLVVIGAPSNAELVFHSGDVKGGQFFADGWLPDGIVGTSQSGYFIRKLKATREGRGYGMVSITTDKTYGPNCGKQIAVLSVKAGAIQYFGDFSFESNNSSAGIQYSKNLDAAKLHIATTFPNSTLPITEGVLHSAKQGRCQTGEPVNIPIYFPIYIPHGR